MVNRFVWIDIARAICIVLVVIGHYIPESAPRWYGEMRSVIYSFHMPLFMFASGFVYIATKRENGYGHFLWRKVKRLMIPYLTVSILVITIKLCTQGRMFVENPVTSWSYIKVFYSPEAGYFLWFIWALWWMFVIIPFFKTSRVRLCLFIVALLLPIASPYFPEVLCLKEFSKMFQYFVAGVIVYDWKQSLMWCRRVPFIVVLIAFCFIEAMPYWDIGNSSLLTAGIGIAFILKFSYKIENKVKTSSWGIGIMTISSASYIIYLLHTTFEGFAKAVVHKVPILMDSQNDWCFSLGALIVISCGVIAPILLDLYVLRRYKVTMVLFGYK